MYSFFAFALIVAEGESFHNSCLEQFEWLEKQGFDVVEHVKVTKDSLPDAVEQFSQKNRGKRYPIRWIGVING